MNLRHPRHLRLKNHTDKLSFNSCDLLNTIRNLNEEKMEYKRKLLTGLAILGLTVAAHAQQVQGFVHQQSEASGYVWPTDTEVLNKLDQWQDQIFGVLFHWGLYSVPGIVESWSICSEDVDWISRKGDLSYDEYKKWYFGLKDQFNPVHFDPEQWRK